jgi:hypothetical protein
VEGRGGIFMEGRGREGMEQILIRFMFGSKKVRGGEGRDLITNMFGSREGGERFYN